MACMRRTRSTAGHVVSIDDIEGQNVLVWISHTALATGSIAQTLKCTHGSGEALTRYTRHTFTLILLDARMGNASAIPYHA